MEKHTRLMARAIYDTDTLSHISEINKRDHAETMLSKFLNGELKDEESICVDWAKAGRDYDLIPWAEGNSYTELFNERHALNDAYSERGVKKGEPLITEVIVGFEKELNIDVAKWGRIQFDYFCDKFSEDNILSAMLHLDSEDNPHAHFILYLTDKSGNLTVFPVLDDSGKLNKAFYIDYEQKMKAFELDEATRKTKASEAKSGNREAEDYYLATIDRYISDNPRTILDDKEAYYDTRGLLSQAASVLPFDKQEEYLDDFLKYFVRNERRTLEKAQTGQMSIEDFMPLAIKELKNLGCEKSAEIEIMQKRIESAVFGNYVLDPLLDDESISDIKVIAPNKIRIKRFGRRMTSNLSFRGEDDYWRFLNGICARNHTDMSPVNAVQNFTDKYSNEKFIQRIVISSNYVNSVEYPYLIIRKINKTKYTIKDLIGYGMLDTKTASYLIDKAKNGKGILFTGKGASGKTSLMNTLLEYISMNNSGLVIQENEELFSNHPDLMFQHVVTARHKGEQEYDLQALARNGLLADLDYFIIGEIKGGEALYFLNAAYTGHKCWASCHGASSTEAMNKLADYVKYESDYTKEDALRMLTSMEVVVFLKNFKVCEISEIVGWNEDKKELIYKPIYRGKG